MFDGFCFVGFSSITLSCFYGLRKNEDKKLGLGRFCGSWKCTRILELEEKQLTWQERKRAAHNRVRWGAYVPSEKKRIELSGLGI